MRQTRRHLLATAAGLSVLPLLPRMAGAEAAPVPGIVYGVGEKFDGSFNEGAFGALEQWKKETGGSYLEYEPRAVTEFGAGVDALVARGATLIVAVGFYYAQPLTDAAAAYPDVRFVLIDAVAEGPNIRCILFREQEGSYLVGVLAALASKTGTIGFVAALDIPLIRKFVDGFGQGAKDTRADIQYLVNFVGVTPAAFNDPVKAGEITKSQIERGADVIFAGSGNSNTGIFQAAKDAGVYAIGVDSNQNGIVPGTILTSMLKRVDQAILHALADAAGGGWTPGVVTLGLAEDGVGWALDDNNRDLITPEMEAAVERARQGIIDGTIKVVDPTAQ
jgi:basic membrane protein A